MSLKRRIFTKDFKQQILREVQAGKSIAQAAREHELHPHLIAKWQKLHVQYAQSAFRATVTPTPRKLRSLSWSG